VTDLAHRIFTEFVFDPGFTDVTTPLAEVLEEVKGIAAGGGFGSIMGRNAFQRPRPEPFFDLLAPRTYSFPSGHTMAATLLYGLLAVFAILLWKGRHWRMLAILGALLAIALVGFSRIALGAHYLTDVLGAIVLGASWLILCLLVVERTRRKRLVAEPEVKDPIEAIEPPATR